MGLEAMKNKVKVAFVGAGYMAKEHLMVFGEIPDAILAGIYSRTRSKAENLAKAFNIPVVADSLEELYAKTQADLLVVTVNVAQMAAMIKECCKYPWTILAEKPVGLNSRESEDVLNYSISKNSIILVALNRRFYESTQILLKELQSTQGSRFIEVHDQQTPEALRRLGKDKLEINNLMYANSIHVIDYIPMLARGDICKIDNIISWQGIKSASSINVSVIYFTSGDVAIYRCIWNAPGPWAVTVTTSQARWELRPLEKIYVQKKDSRILENIELTDLDTKFKPGLYRQACEALKFAKGIKSHSLPLEKAHKTMELIAFLYPENIQ